MILTTTPTVEGRTIVEYKGIVFGEVITGVNFIKDFGVSLRNFFGGRSGSYKRNFFQPAVSSSRTGRQSPRERRRRRSRNRHRL